VRRTAPFSSLRPKAARIVSVAIMFIKTTRVPPDAKVSMALTVAP
jgi:hypothetical protein